MLPKAKRPVMSRTKIDVLIPAIEKDIKVLPYVIDSVRKYVLHPIGRIIIVSPNSERIKALCRRKGCRFVDENTVLPITKKHIVYRTSSWDRSGWLFQQLIKLSGDSLCSQRFYLVIDADTVLIRPHTFRLNKRTIFYCRNWSRAEYFVTYRKLLGKKAARPTSFVTHYMLFEKTKVAALKREIEAKHNMSWYNAIIKNINKSKQITFSEFETYGNYHYARFRNELILRKALNKSLPRHRTNPSAPYIKKLAHTYRSISLHARKWYTRKRKA